MVTIFLLCLLYLLNYIRKTQSSDKVWHIPWDIVCKGPFWAQKGHTWDLAGLYSHSSQVEEKVRFQEPKWQLWLLLTKLYIYYQLIQNITVIPSPSSKHCLFSWMSTEVRGCIKLFWWSLKFTQHNIHVDCWIYTFHFGSFLFNWYHIGMNWDMIFQDKNA